MYHADLKNIIPFLPKDYQSLLSALNQTMAVSMTDTEGVITYINERFLNISKYTRAELIGQNHRILKSNHQSKEMFDELWQTISCGQVWRGEMKNKAKDGSYYWVDMSIAPIIDKNLKPERYIAVQFLITDKKEIEAALQKQNIETEKFALAVKGASEHIIITDPDGIIIYANPAAERTTGYPVSEIIGTKAGALWGGLMDEDFYKKLWKTIKIDKKSFHGEIRNRRKDGREYPALTTISPLLDQNGEIEFFVGFERDITKEKEIDKAKSEFVSLASHQLRTPLSTISWYAEMLLSGDAEQLTTAQLEYMNEIYVSNKRMIDLVNALLNVSRIDLGTFSIQPEPVDIMLLGKTVVQNVKNLALKRKQKLEQQYTPDSLVMNIDPELIQISMENLLTNAIKYTSERGVIHFSIKKKIRTVLITVQDNGFGIPQEQQDEIFTKLFRADNVKSKDTVGTGLGLYLTKSIVEYSGGKIWFESEENKGTNFYIELPLSGMKMKEGARRID